MKHSGEVKHIVDSPLVNDVEQLVETVTSNAIALVGFYMAADTARHILKSFFK